MLSRQLDPAYTIPLRCIVGFSVISAYISQTLSHMFCLSRPSTQSVSCRPVLHISLLHADVTFGPHVYWSRTNRDAMGKRAGGTTSIISINQVVNNSHFPCCKLVNSHILRQSDLGRFFCLVCNFCNGAPLHICEAIRELFHPCY